MSNRVDTTRTIVDPAEHTPNDGRGRRRVMVDGKEYERATYANTRTGVVRYMDFPVKLDRWRKRFVERTVRGRVEVTPMVGG